MDEDELSEYSDHHQELLLHHKDLMERYLAENHNTRCWSGNRFRNIDGTCNNLHNPYWGSILTPYYRLIPPLYEDHVSQPRSKGLPNARELSLGLNELTRKPIDSNHTLITMLWGLFVDHDVTLTAVTELPHHHPVSCCDKEVLNDPENLKHPECFPISIQPNDPFYSKFNFTCMDFVRSAPGFSTKNGKLWGPREQLNQITSYLDGSVVYGSTEEKAHELRDFNGGRLRGTLLGHNDGGERGPLRILPINPAKESFCGKPNDGIFCFKVSKLGKVL